jgi:hypothetical protein
MKRRTLLWAALATGFAAGAGSRAVRRRKTPGRYPPLSSELAKQLAAVDVTDGLYRPCAVRLKDGSKVDRVYIADAQPWFQQWGVWPEEDGGKSSLDIRSVAQIMDSPSRLPAKFANELYEAGESGMGYTIFTVRFRDGSFIVVGTGNAIDFIDYPKGQSPDTVVGVVPHLGRDDPNIRTGPEYRWCLFDGWVS